jgi:PAS domain S-box-containing protein
MENDNHAFPLPASDPQGRRLLRLIESATDRAILLLDPEGFITSWNLGGRQILGHDREEIIGKPFAGLFPEEERQEDRPGRLLAEARDLVNIECEQPLIRENGDRFWSALSLQATRNEAGLFDGYVVRIRDITEGRRAEEALRESERNFRLLVQGVTDYAIFMLDPQGRISSWNTGAERIKGYSVDEILGHHFSCFYTEEDRAAGKPGSMLERALRTGQASDEGWRVRKDGSCFWASVVIDPIRDETGELIGFAKVTRDITERQEMQQALEQAREQLFQVQKLEAVGNLTGGIAHDFNNLLTVIRGSIELAERHAAGNERLKRLLEAVQGAVDRAADLTHQLLAFSRRQPLRPELLNFPKQLLETAGFLDRSLRGDINMMMDVPADLWPVEIDPRQFELALLNVGLNARDAMPRGGTVRIAARNILMDDKRLGLSGDFVKLDISDQGGGIPPHLVQKVIEPFFTTKEVGKGSGLGLSQAYGFAQQSGGALTIESQPGQGTTVTFYLPARSDVFRSLLTEAAPPISEAPPSKGRVLVVEDDLLVAEMAVAALEEDGYSAIQVHCAQDALERLEQGERFDVVFSDIIMPGRMNGVDLAQAICTRYPRTSVLLTTGYSKAAIGEEAKNFPLITKPYKLQELTARIGRLFEMNDRG